MTSMLLHRFYFLAMPFRKIFVIANPSFVPIVLCAGASSRMGQPKELLDFHGRTSLELVLEACREGGLGTPLVVTRAERAEALEARLASRQPRPTVVINARPELGQTSSLRAGLLALPLAATAFLIYPVDFPLVTGADVRRLSARFEAGGARVVVPSFDRRRGHPVVADVAVAAELLALGDGESAREVMNAHRDATAYVDFDDDRVLM